MLLQDTIRANRFKSILDSTDGLVARYIFTADNIQEGKVDANGLKKVQSWQCCVRSPRVRHGQLCILHIVVAGLSCYVVCTHVVLQGSVMSIAQSHSTWQRHVSAAAQLPPQSWWSKAMRTVTDIMLLGHSCPCAACKLSLRLLCYAIALTDASDICILQATQPSSCGESLHAVPSFCC